MTKEQLQQELKSRVKPGVKPSQLKRSKSTGDIPKASPLPQSTPLTKSKSAQELEPNSTQEQLETKISSLELKLEVSQREIDELRAEKQLFAEQLKEKQKASEETRSSLAQAQEQIKELSQAQSALKDQNLSLKHQSLKDWFTQYQKTQQLEQELSQNINYASQELIEQDQKINQLRLENRQLKQQNTSLKKDLALTEKLVQLRQEPFASDTWPTFPHWGLSLISLTLLIWYLFNSHKYD